jgi:two-component system NtrC family sensor kinase
VTDEHSIPTIILLANDLASAHAVRASVRREGMTVKVNTVATPDEFFGSLQSDNVRLILGTAAGLPGLDLSDILEAPKKQRAGSSSDTIPVVLIGGDGQEREEVQALRDGVFDYIHFSESSRLPSVVVRILREYRENTRQERARIELNRAAEILRDNQKLITLGRLMATIVHEINNPLESITNLLYLMEQQPGAMEQNAQYLKLAQRELDRVVQISKQTLTFSRETARPVRVQLADLTEEVLVLYARKIEDRNIRVVRQYGPVDPVTVFPGEMRQVLSNLVANAVEASEANGCLTLRIRSARSWSDSAVRGARLSIADNGSGISQDVRDRLGEPFFTTKGQSGTGLGLWVTRSIVTRYGGSLQFRSSISPQTHGTVFSLFMPTNLRPQAVLPSPDAEVASAVTPRQQQQGSRSPFASQARAAAPGVLASPRRGARLVS